MRSGEDTKPADGESPADRVARSLGWRVVERCAGGEFGAYFVEASSGTRAVLKIFGSPGRATELEASVALVEHLRARGYPAPDYLGVGVAEGFAYTWQAAMPGRVPDRYLPAHSRQHLDLLELHRGDGGTGDWTAEVRSVVSGEHPGWRFEDLRARHPDVAGLVGEIESVDLGGLSLREGDVMHRDFHHRNLLVSGDRITAIIDWEGCRRGDMRFDGFTLGFWASAATGSVSPRVATSVRERVLEEVEPVERAAYAAFLAVHNLEFFSRVGPERLPFAVSAVEGILAPLWRA